MDVDAEVAQYQVFGIFFIALLLREGMLKEIYEYEKHLSQLCLLFCLRNISHCVSPSLPFSSKYIDTIHGAEAILDVLLILVTLSFLLLPLSRAVREYIERGAMFKAYVTNAPKEPHSFIPADLVPDDMRVDEMSEKAQYQQGK